MLGVKSVLNAVLVVAAVVAVTVHCDNNADAKGPEIVITSSHQDKGENYTSPIDLKTFSQSDKVNNNNKKKTGLCHSNMLI